MAQYTTKLKLLDSLLQEMLLRAKDRRWLSSEVQSDLLLICTDGSVQAHSALLAGSSPFLSRLLSQPTTSHCAGCRTLRQVTLAGVGQIECKALIDLLYTGVAPLYTDVTKIMELCALLGMEFAGLCVSTRRGSTGIRDVRLDVQHREENNTVDPVQEALNCDDSIDSVHPRFLRKTRILSEDTRPSVRVSGLSPRPSSPTTLLSTPTGASISGSQVNNDQTPLISC